MTELKFAPVSQAEHAYIRQILLRAEQHNILHKNDRLTLEMDLRAVMRHTPLNLKQLANFGDGDFAHDITGIQYHIDRRTGTLTECFLPRCAR
jgi:hypothetical protein